MALSINTNVAALNAYRNLSNTQGDMGKSLEKLSSGFRINRAADDAAGLAISEGMRSQIGGLKIAVRNAQDAISLVQTAEGALNETNSILQRMRDLSVQASSSGSLNAAATANIQTEITQLNSELTRISDTTTFNNQKLLDGTYSGTFQVGANAGETISVGLAGAGMGAVGLNTAGINVTVAAANAVAATTVAHVGGTAGSVTVTTPDLTTTAGFDQLNGSITVGNKTLDLDTVVYGATDNVATRTATLNAAVNAAFGSSIGSSAVSGGDLVVTGVAGSVGDSAAQVLKDSVSFQAATGASAAITVLDAALSTVSTTRAGLGAVQNRFEHTINNLNTAVENMSASESRIRDTDMASEMVNLTRSQILSQAGIAMLAQAKSAPQDVLQLLR